MPMHVMYRDVSILSGHCMSLIGDYKIHLSHQECELPLAVSMKSPRSLDYNSMSRILGPVSQEIFIKSRLNRDMLIARMQLLYQA